MAKRSDGGSVDRKILTVTKWRESGLSQAEFCRREGLQQWQLSAWKHIVERSGRKKKGSAEHLEVEKSRTARSRSRRTRSKQQRQEIHGADENQHPFVPVRVVDVTTTTGGDSIRSGDGIDCVLEVILKRGQVVRVAPNCAPQFLGAVVSALDL